MGISSPPASRSHCFAILSSEPLHTGDSFSLKACSLSSHLRLPQLSSLGYVPQLIMLVIIYYYFLLFRFKLPYSSHSTLLSCVIAPSARLLATFTPTYQTCSTALKYTQAHTIICCRDRSQARGCGREVSSSVQKEGEGGGGGGGKRAPRGAWLKRGVL